MATNKDFIVKNGLQVGGDIVVTGSLQTAGLTLPASDGTSGQVIVTDGSGNLSFQSVTTNAFSRIEVNGQTTITTDQVGDTLSFVAGDNITITTDEPNDAITISASQYTDAEAVDAVEAAEHLTIDGGTLYVDTANNYVGIGDTSPQHKLDVAGGIGINGTEVIDTSGEIVTAQLKNSGVTAGSYGSASEVPVITVDAKGRVTSASTTAVAGVESVTYNASGSEALRINTSDGGQQSVSLALGGSLVGPLDDITVTYSATEPASPSQGTFYFDSLNQKMKVYTGSAWIDAVPAGTGGGEGGETTDAVATMEKFQYTIASTTNAVSGSDDNSNTLSYIVDGSQNIEVFVNGIKQFEGATNDYVATTGSSVTFTYNLEQDDVVDVQVYELLTQDAFYLKNETFTKTETNTQIANAVNGYLPLTGGTLTGDLVTTGLTVDTDTLVVDKLNNRVGIGTNNPLYPLSVAKDLGAGGTLATFDNSNSTYSQNLRINFDSSKDITFEGGSGNGGFIFAPGSRGTVFSNGNVGIGVDNPSTKLDIIQDTNGVDDGIKLRPENDSQSLIYSFQGLESTYLIDYNCGSGKDHTFKVGGTEVLSIAANGLISNKYIQSGEYFQGTGSGSTAWAFGSTGGNEAPLLKTDALGFHNWDGSSWSNEFTVYPDNSQRQGNFSNTGYHQTKYLEYTTSTTTDTSVKVRFTFVSGDRVGGSGKIKVSSVNGGSGISSIGGLSASYTVWQNTGNTVGGDVGTVDLVGSEVANDITIGTGTNTVDLEIQIPAAQYSKSLFIHLEYLSADQSVPTITVVE